MQLCATPQSKSTMQKGVRKQLGWRFTEKQHRNQITQRQLKTLKANSYQLELPAPVVRVLDATVCPQGSDGRKVV